MISINEFRSLVVTIYLDPAQTQKKKKKKKAKQSKNANAHVHNPQNPLAAIFLSLVSGQLDKGIHSSSSSSACILPPANATNNPNPPISKPSPPTTLKPPPQKSNNIPKRQDLASFPRGPLHKTLQPPLPKFPHDPPNRTVLVSSVQLALIRADGWMDGWMVLFWGGGGGCGGTCGGWEVEGGDEEGGGGKGVWRTQRVIDTVGSS